MEQFLISIFKLREAQKNWDREKTVINLEAKVFWEMDVDNHLKNMIKKIAKSEIMQLQLHKIFEQ